jgi:outer membrane immunogenic protein
MGWIRECALLLAVAGLAAASAGAVRADGEVVGVTDVPYRTDWTGFYIGGKLGGAWSNVTWTQDASLFNPLDQNAPVTFSPNGIAGGIIGGGNLQVGHWIFGMELAYIGANLTQTTSSPFAGVGATDTFTTKIDWLGTIEGRIGFQFANFLVFTKGGWAGTNASLTGTSTRPGVGTQSSSEFVDGWTIGGGVDMLCWHNIVLGLEYEHVNLDLNSGNSCPFCIAGIQIATPQALGGKANLDSVMVRASYLFAPED